MLICRTVRPTSTVYPVPLSLLLSCLACSILLCSLSIYSCMSALLSPSISSLLSCLPACLPACLLLHPLCSCTPT